MEVMQRKIIEHMTKQREIEDDLEAIYLESEEDKDEEEEVEDEEEEGREKNEEEMRI